ncbi:MAG: ribosome-binding factor A [Kofleriaceae bacterium]
MCRQVFDALTYALAELADPLIDELVLVAVTPAPNAARVQVTMAFPPSHPGPDIPAALARLQAVASVLRQEVATEVTRARVPELVFRIDLSPPAE